MPDLVNQFPFSHKRIKEENPGMWQDFYIEGRPFGKVSGFKDDFLSWVAANWIVTETGTCTQSILDARNGVLSLISGGTENDGSNLQLGGTSDGATTGECFAPATGKNIWFECSIASPAWTQHELFVGLHIQDTSVAESRGTDYIGFRSVDGGATIDAQSSNASVVSATAVYTPTDSATTFVKLGFKVTSLDKIEFYVNDVLLATHTTTVIPTTEMKLTIAHTCGEAVAKTLNVDFISCFQDR